MFLRDVERPCDRYFKTSGGLSRTFVEDKLLGTFPGFDIDVTNPVQSGLLS